MVLRSCAHDRHEWSSTTAPGWFCCTRLLDSKIIKGRGFGITAKAVYCQAVAHCPGCLGARYAQVPLVLCVLHQDIRVEDLPVVYPVARASRPASSSPAPSGEQRSLW